jgi:hypothetical protein
MSEIINLNDDLLIANGGGRTCFIHPEDDTKVIKIIHTEEGISNNQNDIDYKYINYLRKHNKDLSYISSCYEYIKTNLGDGLVFDRIVNYDKTPCKSFRYFIAKKIISFEVQKELLDELKIYLEKEEILFVDNSSTNILCQEIEKDKYKLIIIDGLGAKRNGPKFWLYLRVKLYRDYKIKKQWQKFIQSYKKDLKRIALNKNPITRF